jgi:hypothetical protein
LREAPARKFHGVGAQPRDLVPLGQLLAAEFPDSFIVSIPGAHRSDLDVLPSVGHEINAQVADAVQKRRVRQ